MAARSATTQVFLARARLGRSHSALPHRLRAAWRAHGGGALARELSGGGLAPQLATYYCASLDATNTLSPHMLVVRDLPLSTSEEMVHAAFSKFGEVASVRKQVASTYGIFLAESQNSTRKMP